MNLLAAEHQTVGNPVANIGIFALFVVITLFVVIRAGRKKSSAAEFFTGGREFSGPQNGIAIAGAFPQRAFLASRALSRCTATTGSCTPLDSWWRGWWRCS